MQIESFQNRKINPNIKVKIYRNLNKKGYVYSIKQNGLVVGYCSFICLKNCRFIVNQKGRDKVLKEKRKNVHAYIDGFLTKELPATKAKVFYNPYKCKYFINEDNNYIHSSEYVCINGGSITC